MKKLFIENIYEKPIEFAKLIHIIIFTLKNFQILLNLIKNKIRKSEVWN